MSTPLPRPELREKAFRSFEHAISCALAASQTDFAPALHIPPLTQHTWAARFRDACLAYRRFGYASEVIAPGTTLLSLRVYELDNGHVRVINTARTTADPAKRHFRDATEQAFIEAECAMLAERVSSEPLLVRWHSPAEKEWLLALEQRFDVTVASAGEHLLKIQ